MRISKGENILGKDTRMKQAIFASYVGIVGNLFLALVKWIVGTLSGSHALIADAVHSASDIPGSLAVLIGIKAANQPPDRDHPYGHGKAESIAAIIVAVLLFLIGIQMCRSSVMSFFGEIKAPGTIAIYPLMLSIVLKEWMFRYKYNLGKRINSQALIVNAYEHRSDVFSSFAALIGIAAAIIGGKLEISWLEYADPVAGVFVSLLVLKMGWSLGIESIHRALDHVLHDEDTVHFFDAVLMVEGVKRIDSLYAREHGHYVIIDLKIAVNPQVTVEVGHKIATSVREKLMTFSNVHDVLVHVNPYYED